jgi:hypothetical protein
MILVVQTTIFWVPMMNKLYYGCSFPYIKMLFYSSKLLKLKYIHHYFFLKFPTKKSGCVLWAGASYRPGNTVSNIFSVIKYTCIDWSSFHTQLRRCLVHWTVFPQPLSSRNMYSAVYMATKKRGLDSMLKQSCFVLSQRDSEQLISRSGFELDDSQTRNTSCVHCQCKADPLI